MKRTPLYAAHQKLGGRLIEFGGWEMPVQYSGIVDEHLTVRKAAGLFDICHMGEVQITGAGAEAFLNRTLTNDIRNLAPGQGQYTLMCNARGGVIDDLYAYRLFEQEYLLIINASRIEADVSWLKQCLASDPARQSVTLHDASAEMGAVAVQGPRAVDFINGCFPGTSTAGTQAATVTDLKKNRIARFHFQTGEIWIGRTGYTGEDGFEVVAPAGLIQAVWNIVLEKGQPCGLKPAGLGARDTLRTEVCYPLYGHELDEKTTPIEAGLGFFVALDKGEFNGRATLEAQKQQGPSRKLVAIRMTCKSAPPRPQYAICRPGADKIGELTSGTLSPSLNAGIGLGYVSPAEAKPQTPVEIEIRGKRAAALVLPKPLYRKP